MGLRSVLCYTMGIMKRERYEILDGLRGVAALYIVVYHLFEGVHIVLGHGYLGVDFFYALSGFVIGYAYDGRWGEMTLKDFFKRRLIRLHPMVLMGLLIGLCLYPLGIGSAFPIIGTVPMWKVLLIFLYCCFMLPMPNAWDVRGWQDTNSFNGNIWSLYWEYLANIVYAFILRRLPTVVLAGLAVIAALGTLEVTLFSPAHAVNGGWSLTTNQLYLGAVRLAYPFLVGLILSRIKLLLRLPGGFWSCSAVVILMMAVPKMTGLWNGVYEAASILILLPLIVSWGAGSTIKGEKTLAFCKLLGELSYPLYIVHLPLVYAQMAWLAEHPTAPLSHKILLSTGLGLLSLGIAYAASRLYDIPIRRWLSRH